MSVAMLRGTLVSLLLVGCFRPDIKNGAFVCEPSDDPPCPSGFYCVHGRCVDAPGSDDASVAHDLGMQEAGAVEDLADDLASGRDLADDDVDLWSPRDLLTPRDLATPPDLSTKTDMACGHAGAPCTSVNECCSNYCRTDGICIGG
jgi:hypothetical protein